MAFDKNCFLISASVKAIYGSGPQSIQIIHSICTWIFQQTEFALLYTNNELKSL